MPLPGSESLHQALPALPDGSACARCELRQLSSILRVYVFLPARRRNQIDLVGALVRRGFVYAFSTEMTQALPLLPSGAEAWLKAPTARSDSPPAATARE